MLSLYNLSSKFKASSSICPFQAIVFNTKVVRSTAASRAELFRVNFSAPARGTSAIETPHKSIESNGVNVGDEVGAVGVRRGSRRSQCQHSPEGSGIPHTNVVLVTAGIQDHALDRLRNVGRE